MATYFANCNTLNLDVSVNRGVSESCVSESWRTDRGIDPLGPKEEKGLSLTYKCLRIEFIVNFKIFLDERL
jgi:hypothetical protein